MNPFTPSALASLAQQHGTPLWVYDAATITARVQALRQFDVVRFAQKANSNTHILRLLKSEGVMVDAVSLGEVERALAAGYVPGLKNGHAEIVFTADLLDRTTLPRLALQGLHMHIGSGVDYAHLQEVCGAMVGLVRTVKAQGMDLHAVSAGGGLSIPYGADEAPIDTAHYFSLWDAARQRIAQDLGHAVALELEPGRYLVAESGVLVAEVRATKAQGSQHFVMVDAGFSDLMRPSMYGSYHGMEILHADGTSATGAAQPTVVAGPLCESGDVFTQGEGGVVLQRDLPAAQVGDLLVVHDTGAYGASMSSNYNTRPLIPEVLVECSGQARLIRRKQTVAELIALEAV